MSKSSCGVGIAILLSISAAYGFAQQQKWPANDIPPNFKAPVQQTDFDKRVAMIPMRDGTKLYTVIVVPKGKQGGAHPADADMLQRR